jgi:hypothetical protein
LFLRFSEVSTNAGRQSHLLCNCITRPPCLMDNTLTDSILSDCLNDLFANWEGQEPAGIVKDLVSFKPTRRSIERKRTPISCTIPMREREYAYDRKSPVGKLDKALDEAAAIGWRLDRDLPAASLFSLNVGRN